MKPSRKREWAPELMRRFGASERQALRMVCMSAAAFRYRSTAREAGGLRLRIKEITDTHVHYGYRRVHVLLRREGYQDNVKRVHRLYREAGLSLRLKRPRRTKAAKCRQPKQQFSFINETWGMDFVADAQFDGRKIRMLTVVDCYTCECLAIEVGQSLKGEDVVMSLQSICAERGLPRSIKTDNVLNASRHFLRGNSDPGRAARANRRCEAGQYTNYPVVFRGRAGEPCLTIVDTRFIATSA